MFTARSKLSVTHVFMSSRYACKNDGIRNNCDVIVPNHDCH